MGFVHSTDKGGGRGGIKGNKISVVATVVAVPACQCVCTAYPCDCHVFVCVGSQALSAFAGECQLESDECVELLIADDSPCSKAKRKGDYIYQ